MKLEKGIITNSQLMFLLIAFMQSMALSVNFSLPFTGQSTWIVVIAAYVVAVLAALMYLAIAKGCPDKNLVQINDEAFGPYLGKAVSVVYIWFFFQLVIHYMYFFNSFWITYIMPETPRPAFLIMFGIVCFLAVREGIEVIARCGTLFAAIVWLTTFTLVVLLLGEMEPSNLLPVLDVPLKDFIQSTHIMVAIPYCDIVVFLMIFPYAADQTKLKKPVLIGISLAALQLLIVVLRDVLVLGVNVGNVSSASFMAARQIDIADVLTRMDILVAISLLTVIFMKLAVFYYVTVLGTAQVLHLRSYKPLIIPIGVLAVTIGVALYPSDMEQVYAAQYAWPFNTVICEFLLPAVTVLVIGIRRLVGGNRGIEAK
jgi:spore germination protein KB